MVLSQYLHCSILIATGSSNLYMFIDGRIFSLQRQGGISRLYYELLRFLAPEVKCTLYRGLFLDSYDWDQISLSRNIGYKWGLSSRYLGPIKKGVDLAWLEFEWMTSNAPPHDLYISTYYRVPKLAEKSRVIVGDYDCTHERFPELFPGVERIKEIKKQAFNKADLILTISESSKLDVMKFYGISEKKIEVFHLGVNAFFNKPTELVSSCLNAKPYLLYVGSRASYKNFSILQEAFESGLGTEYDLVVVGGGELTDSERVSFGDTVQWHPADDNKLRELYQKATVFVYPSRYEGFGLPPLEALACGTPVVVADHPVSHEVLSEHAEYFSWNDVVGLKSAIKRAARRDKELCKQDYEHAKGYTWEKSASSFFSKINAC